MIWEECRMMSDTKFNETNMNVMCWQCCPWQWEEWRGVPTTNQKLKKLYSIFCLKQKMMLAGFLHCLSRLPFLFFLLLIFKESMTAEEEKSSPPTLLLSSLRYFHSPFYFTFKIKKKFLISKYGDVLLALTQQYL